MWKRKKKQTEQMADKLRLRREKLAHLTTIEEDDLEQVAGGDNLGYKMTRCCQ